LIHAAEQPSTAYDLVITGGAFSGAATATLVRYWQPSARVLVIERGERFGRGVGEATVECSGYSLTHVLGLDDELSRHHLPKHGLRLWFADRPDCGHTAIPRSARSSCPPCPRFNRTAPGWMSICFSGSANRGRHCPTREGEGGVSELASP